MRCWMMRSKTSGFTLVEMVVSLTILSLLTLATLTAVRTLGDTQSRLEATASRLDELRLVSQFLRNSLRQARPLSTSLSFSGFFKGEEQELSWVAPLQGVQGVAGMQFMRLFRQDDDLFIQFLPYHQSTDEPEWTGVRAHLLLDAVNEFRAQYRARRGEPWLNEWDAEAGGSGAPQWVKLELKVRERFWPDIIVPLDFHGSAW